MNVCFSCACWLVPLGCTVVLFQYRFISLSSTPRGFRHFVSKDYECQLSLLLLGNRGSWFLKTISANQHHPSLCSYGLNEKEEYLQIKAKVFPRVRKWVQKSQWLCELYKFSCKSRGHKSSKCPCVCSATWPWPPHQSRGEEGTRNSV